MNFEQAAAAQQHIDTQIEGKRQEYADSSEGFNKVQGRFYQLGADVSRIEEAIAFNGGFKTECGQVIGFQIEPEDFRGIKRE